MDKVIKEHQNNSHFKCCVYSGNNSSLIKKLLAQNFNQIEEIDYKDEKHAMQAANFIWK
mgnify:CR=1 FL=1